jgi:hypothetical protein
MKPLIITPQIVSETLRHLQEGGRRHVECVVLWLGSEDNNAITVRQVYRPEQIAGADVFHIPPPAMRKLLGDLGMQDMMIAAQVHSHPQEAFHSRADDAWAIVRHVDALSLVLPHFALKTDAESFFKHMKSFRLTAANKWIEVNDNEVGKWISLR